MKGLGGTICSCYACVYSVKCVCCLCVSVGCVLRFVCAVCACRVCVLLCLCVAGGVPVYLCVHVVSVPLVF